MADLEARVAHLEQQMSALQESVKAAPPARVLAGDAWLVETLDERHPEGAVVFAGNPSTAAGPVRWQWGCPTADLMDGDWSDAATSLAALGHPVRLELLRLVLQGVVTTHELAETPGLGTTGQLHHHLRTLVSAGWLTTAGRGRYQVPPTRVVPLLAVVSATTPG